MFISDLTNADSIPTLEASAQFAAQRQRLIAHNVANLSTPNFRELDVSVDAFRSQLSDAVGRRRARFGGLRGDLPLRDSREVETTARGGIRLNPTEAGGNILFHDRNDRDLERMMQDLVENVGAFRVASELLRSRMDLLRTAISERA